MSRSVAQTVAANTTVMIASQSVTWISSFILMLFLPRYLGSENYGKLFLAVSVTTMFQMIVEFGGGYYIAKEVSRESRNLSVIVSNSIAVRFLLWAAAFAVMMWGLFAVGYSMTVITLIYILGFSKLWEGVSKVFHSTCQGLERMQYPALAAIVERLTVTALSVAALTLGADVIVIAIIMAAGSLLSFSILSGLMNGIIPYLWKPRWSEMKRISGESIPYFLWMFFSVAYFRIDAVMLSLMVPEEVVGWYGAAYRLYDVLMFLPSIYTLALFPSLTKLWNAGNDALARTTCKSLQIMVLTGIPVSIAIVAYADNVISLFYGNVEFAPAALLLKIFAVGLPLIYVDFVLGTTLFASDRQRQWTLTAFLALLINPALNAVMIPYTQQLYGNGGIGAAVATVATELFVMTMALIFLPRSAVRGFSGSVVLKGCAAGCVMGAAVWLLQGREVPWVLSGIVAGLVYGSLLIMLKVLEPSEIEFLRRFLSFRNLKEVFILSREPRT